MARSRSLSLTKIRMPPLFLPSLSTPKAGWYPLIESSYLNLDVFLECNDAYIFLKKSVSKDIYLVHNSLHIPMKYILRFISFLNLDLSYQDVFLLVFYVSWFVCGSMVDRQRHAYPS